MFSMTQYTNLSARTTADTFFPDRVLPSWLIGRLSEFVSISDRIDKAKKALFYGKPTDKVPSNPDQEPYHFHPDIIHAILGIATEASELVQLLLSPPKDLRLKVVDEGGDLLWYIALLFRHFGISFEEAALKNIEKLKARYPDGFNSSAAIHRDEDKELAAIQ